MGSSPCLPLHSQGSQISSQRSLLSALTPFIFLNLNPYVLCTCIVCLKSSSSGLCMPHWFILLYISVKNLPFTTRSKIGTVCYSLLHQRLLFTSHILAPNPIHFSFGILNNLKLLLLISLIFFFSPSAGTLALSWQGYYLLFHCCILSNWTNALVMSDEQIFVKRMNEVSWGFFWKQIVNNSLHNVKHEHVGKCILG